MLSHRPLQPAYGHCQEDIGDIPAGARRAPEAHEAEGTCHGDAGTDIAIHESYDKADDRGKDDERCCEGARMPRLEAIGSSKHPAVDEDHQHAGKKRQD